MSKPRLALVMPFYNEGAIIGKVIDNWTYELERNGVDFMIHIYNDGSVDEQSKALRKAASLNQKVVIHEHKNMGHGPTILKAYNENSDADWVFQIDSDDEMDASGFSNLWTNRHDFDFLIGKRSGRHSPASRCVISFVSRLTVRLFYGRGVYDVNSPYRLMRSSKFKEYFSTIPADTFAPNVILSGMACLDRQRVYEAPVMYDFRRTGEVSIKKLKLLKSAAKALGQTISFRFMVKHYK